MLQYYCYHHKISPVVLSVCVTGVSGCLQSEVIGDVISDRPGTHRAAMETKQEPSAVWSQTANNDSGNGTQVCHPV